MHNVLFLLLLVSKAVQGSFDLIQRLIWHFILEFYLVQRDISVQRDIQGIKTSGVFKILLIIL